MQPPLFVSLLRSPYLPSSFNRPFALQDLAGALFPEGIHLLAGKAHQQAVLRFVLRHVLDDVGHGLRDRNPLDRSLPPQLLGDGPLLLKVRSHDVHYGRL